MRYVESLECRTFFSAVQNAATFLGDWTAVRGSNSRAGYAPGSVGRSVLRQSWKVDITTNSYPTIADDRLFVAAASGTYAGFNAFDAATGNLLWSQKGLAGGNIRGSTYYNGSIYFIEMGTSSTLYVLNASNGAIQSSISLPGGEYVSPSVSNLGIWAVRTDQSAMVGYSLDGTLISSQTFQGKEGLQSVASSSNAITMFTRSTSNYGSTITQFLPSGAVKWTADSPAFGFNQGLAVTEDTVYFSTNRYLNAYDAGTGLLRWSAEPYLNGIDYNTELFQAPSPTVSGDAVFVLGGTRIMSFSTATGAVLKTYELPVNSIVSGAPVVTDDRLFVPFDQNTYVFDRTSGEVLERLPWGKQLAIADNRLFIMSPSRGFTPGGTLYAYDFKENVSAIPTVPASTNEGTTITLTGDSSRAVIAWEWDFDYNPAAGFTIDSTERNPQFYVPDGPSTRTIALRVSTADAMQDIATRVLNISNVAPTATVSLNNTVIQVGTVSDVTGEIITYSYDYNGDGVYDVVNSADSTKTISPSFILSGPTERTLRVKLSDDDGGFTVYEVPYSTNDIKKVPTASVIFQERSFVISDVSPGLSANISYSLDFNNDGTIDVAGGSDTVISLPSAFILAGPAEKTLRLRIYDDLNQESIVMLSYSTAAIKTVPTASVKYEDRKFVVSGISLGLSPAVLFSYDFNGDGTFDLVGTTEAVVPLPADFIRSGPVEKTLRMRIYDDLGQESLNVLPYSTSGISLVPTIAGSATTEATFAYQLALDASLTPFVVDHWLISWGDGKTSNVAGTDTSASHVYTKDGVCTITATAVGEGQSLAANPVAVKVASIADLAVSLGSTPAVMIPGKSYKFAVKVDSLGSLLASGSLPIQLLRSMDSTLSEDDVVFATIPAKLKLKPGTSKTFSKQVVIPGSWDDTTGYYFARVDPANLLAERDEGNNVSAVSSETYFRKYYVDVGFSGLKVSKKVIQAGKSYVVGVNLRNFGNAGGSGHLSYTMNLLRVTSLGYDMVKELESDGRNVTVAAKFNRYGDSKLVMGLDVEPGKYVIQMSVEFDEGELNPANNTVYSAPITVVR